MYPYLRVDVCVLSVADHLGALLHVLLKVLLVRVQERRHRRLQDAREHLDLKMGRGSGSGSFTRSKTTNHCNQTWDFL